MILNNKDIQLVKEVTGATESDPVELSNMLNGYSIQIVATVSTPSAKTFDAGEPAELTDQDLTYTASQFGIEGNSTSITLVDPGTPGSPLSVSVDGQKIIASLATSPGVNASLTVQDATITSVEPGVAGNLISVTYEDDATAGDESVTTVGPAITVHMESGESTAEQIKAAWDISSAVVYATYEISGTGTDAQTAFSADNLEDGVDPGTITTDADTLKAAINGNTDAANLVVVSGTGSDPLDALPRTFLTGGVLTEVDVSNDAIIIPAHGFTTGLVGQLTTDDVLPGGLSTSTDYFVIVVDNNTIKLATSRANALAGTAVNITSQGDAGTINTFTATALSGGSFKVQKSNDGQNWTDVDAATNITSNATFWVEKVDPQYKFIKLVFAATAGRITAKNNIFVRGT